MQWVHDMAQYNIRKGFHSGQLLRASPFFDNRNNSIIAHSGVGTQGRGPGEFIKVFLPSEPAEKLPLPRQFSTRFDLFSRAQPSASARLASFICFQRRVSRCSSIST